MGVLFSAAFTGCIRACSRDDDHWLSTGDSTLLCEFVPGARQLSLTQEMQHAETGHVLVFVVAGRT